MPPVPDIAVETALAIERQLVRYAQCIDSRDFAGLDGVFAPDARIDFRQTGGIVGSLDEVRTFLREELARFRVLQHFISNIRHADDSTEGLHTHAYVLAKHGFRRPNEKALTFFTLGGEYEDRWRHTPDGWRITQRVLHLRFIEGDTA